MSFELFFRDTGNTVKTFNSMTELNAYFARIPEDALKYFDARPRRLTTEELLVEIVKLVNACNSPDMLGGYLDEFAEYFNADLPRDCPRFEVYGPEKEST